MSQLQVRLAFMEVRGVAKYGFVHQPDTKMYTATRYSEGVTWATVPARFWELPIGGTDAKLICGAGVGVAVREALGLGVEVGEGKGEEVCVGVTVGVWEGIGVGVGTSCCQEKSVTMN